MYVTYKLYNNNKIILHRKNDSCFSDLYDYGSWDYIILKIKTSVKNKELEDFWLDLVQKIETKVEIVQDKKYGKCIKLPYLGNRGKTLFILSIIRYLWENTNCYDQVVPMTKKFLELYPDVDILKAITICSSNLDDASGWGHSIVIAIADVLPHIWHYRRFKSFKCHDLCNPKGYYAVSSKNNDKLFDIRLDKKHEFDFEPILKHYNLEL